MINKIKEYIEYKKRTRIENITFKIKQPNGEYYIFKRYDIKKFENEFKDFFIMLNDFLENLKKYPNINYKVTDNGSIKFYYKNNDCIFYTKILLTYEEFYIEDILDCSCNTEKNKKYCEKYKIGRRIYQYNGQNNQNINKKIQRSLQKMVEQYENLDYYVKSRNYILSGLDY